MATQIVITSLTHHTHNVPAGMSHGHSTIHPSLWRRTLCQSDSSLRRMSCRWARSMNWRVLCFVHCELLCCARAGHDFFFFASTEQRTFNLWMPACRQFRLSMLLCCLPDVLPHSSHRLYRNCICLGRRNGHGSAAWPRPRGVLASEGQVPEACDHHGATDRTGEERH